jgi:hypothetical protein
MVTPDTITAFVASAVGIALAIIATVTLDRETLCQDLQQNSGPGDCLVGPGDEREFGERLTLVR